MQEAIKRYLGRAGFGAFRPKAVLCDMDGVLINSMPNRKLLDYKYGEQLKDILPGIGLADIIMKSSGPISTCL